MHLGTKKALTIQDGSHPTRTEAYRAAGPRLRPKGGRLPRSNFLKVGRETTYEFDMSKLDGVNYSDIRSMASQDDDTHYSITSRVARASQSSSVQDLDLLDQAHNCDEVL